jgi:CHAT domain-containing protein
LSSFPFEGIRVGKQLLGEIVTLGYCSSFNVARELRRRLSLNPFTRLLVIGYRDGDLKTASDEIDNISKSWSGTVEVIDGARLQKSKVIEALSVGFDVIHFVGHGTSDRVEPLRSSIRFSCDENSDKMQLTVEDILRTSLPNHPLLVMSACTSGEEAAFTAGEMVGLAGSFIRRGACGVIASRWPIRDSIGRDTSALIFERLQAAGPRKALFDAQSTLRKKCLGIDDWAAFRYIGA